MRRGGSGSRARSAVSAGCPQDQIIDAVPVHGHRDGLQAEPLGDPVVRTAVFDAASGSFIVPARTAAVFVAPRPAADQVALLEGDVEALIAAAALSGGQGRALLAKLAAARRRLSRGHLPPARGVLGAFVHQLEAFERSGVLTEAQAAPVLAEARAILGLIGG